MVRTYEITNLTTAVSSPSQKFAVVHSMVPKGGERTFAAVRNLKPIDQDRTSIEFR